MLAATDDHDLTTHDGWVAWCQALTTIVMEGLVDTAAASNVGLGSLINELDDRVRRAGDTQQGSGALVTGVGLVSDAVRTLGARAQGWYDTPGRVPVVYVCCERGDTNDDVAAHILRFLPPATTPAPRRPPRRRRHPRTPWDRAEQALDEHSTVLLLIDRIDRVTHLGDMPARLKRLSTDGGLVVVAVRVDEDAVRTGRFGPIAHISQLRLWARHYDLRNVDDLTAERTEPVPGCP